MFSVKKVIIFFVLFTFSVNAETLPEGEVAFLPHMATHIKEGCPANSTCPDQIGLKRQAWLDTLKTASLGKRADYKLLDSFVQKNGIPFAVWGHKKATEDKNFIWWDSPCFEHQKEGQEEYVGLLVLKNLAQVDPQLFHLEVLYSEEGPNTYKKRHLPRSRIPSYFKGGTTYLTEFMEGLYYTLSINEQGDLGIAGIAGGYQTTKTITCPVPLVEHFKKMEGKNPIYLDYSCKLVWDLETRKYIPIIIGRTCL